MDEKFSPIKFYDTNALLHNLKDIENNENVFNLSSITIEELENIKTSSNKDDEIKFKARQVVRFLNENENKYNVIIANNNHYKMIEDLNLPITNDNLIIACAKDLQNKGTNIIFETNDLLCNLIAKECFKLSTNKIKDRNSTEDNYKGYKEIIMTDEEMSEFYSKENKENLYELLDNEYLIIKDTLNQPVDAWRFNGLELVELDVKLIKSNMAGKLKAKDFYQQCVLDSFYNNQITVVKGKAGSGKSFLAMNFLLSQLEKDKIDKIIMFINDAPVRNANLHGFLPGTLIEKLCESQIGNFLMGKLGDKLEITRLVSMGKLLLLPISDIRGFETPPNSALYMTEAQNTSIDMLKLCLQRVSENSICIIDGDYNTQVDNNAFAGNNNGMRRLSEVFKGKSMYGEIELKECYRSEIGKIAELM